MRSAVAPDPAVRPLRNLALTPLGEAWSGDQVVNRNVFAFNTRWYGSGSTGTLTKITGASDGPLPFVKEYVRKTWTTVGGNVFDVGMDLTGYKPAGTYGRPVTPGEVFTASVYVRSSVRTAYSNKRRIYWEFFDAAGAMVGGGNAGVDPPALETNVWYRLSATVSVPANAVWIQMRSDIWINNPEAAVGMTLDHAAFMITPGSGLLDYADPNLPGWRWTGTTNRSESAGYPYTLESIAGKSLAWRENTTGSVTPGTFDLPAIQGNGVSIYVVQNMPAAPPLRGVQYHDAAGLDSLTIEHFDGANPGRSTAARSRGGTNNWRTANNSLAVTGGRSYAAATVAADGNIATIHTREGSSASASPVGDGVPRPCRLTTPNPVIYAGAFKGEHNRETVLRIMAWLARKYGAPVPSGY